MHVKLFMSDIFEVELFVFEYLKPFNCVKTIGIFVCKQNGSESFKNKITYKLLT